jgi:hypothetical protein
LVELVGNQLRKVMRRRDNEPSSCSLLGGGIGYVEKVEKDVELQLSRAGIRLAFLLNKDLGSEQADWDTCLKSPQDTRVSMRRMRRER